jgi:predicted DNA-binding transcriptional regulator YafY
LAGKDHLFHSIEKAIVGTRQISFDYQKEHEMKSYATVEPYKLLNHRGIWYLAGKDLGRSQELTLFCS